MQPLLLWNDAYVIAKLLKVLLIAGLIMGVLTVLVVWDAKVRAARPPVPTPVPPASLLKRLTWFEWLLVAAAILAALRSV